MTCPRCGGGAGKVIFLGFPMRLCDDPGCVCLWGVWSWIASTFPIGDADGDFCFLRYEGSYLSGLLAWWRYA